MNQAVPYQETTQFIRQRYEDTSLVIFHNYQRTKTRGPIKPAHNTFPPGVSIGQSAVGARLAAESGGAGDSSPGIVVRSGVAAPEGTSSEARNLRPDHQSGSKVCQVI